MRKLIVSNLVSLDGFFEGPSQELDWFVLNEEFFDYARDLLNTVDTIIYGRVTYEQMASYWPTTSENDPVITHKMNNLQKIVFSKTLSTVEWNNSRLAKGNSMEEISKLKQQPGKDLVIFGSGSLVSSFAQLGLIDEYRLIMNPVILGKGNPLFKNLDEKLKLKLLNTKPLSSGVVILYFQPARETERSNQFIEVAILKGPAKNNSMVEVFRTNVKDVHHAGMLIDQIHNDFPDYKANFDLGDCDNILRVRCLTGVVQSSLLIILLRDFGFEAEVLPDDIQPVRRLISANELFAK